MTTSGSGSLIPSPMIVNQGYPSLSGMRLTYVSTTSFTVGSGQARDHLNVMDILMGNTLPMSSGPGGTNSISNSAAVTVSISVKGAGGLDVGTIAASKLYSVFAIGDSRGFNAGSAVVSLAVPSVGPSLPLGYDSWRYIGSVATDASSHVRPFKQTGGQVNRTMWYDSGTLSTTTVGLAIPSSATAASQNTFATIGVLTTLVPQTALQTIIYASLLANAAGDSLWVAPFGAVGAFTGFASPAASTMKMSLFVPSAFNAAGTPIVEIDYATSSATATVAFTLPGYVDQL